MNSMWLQSEILISSFIHISDWSRISVLFTYLDFMISRSEVIERCDFFYLLGKFYKVQNQTIDGI